MDPEGVRQVFIAEPRHETCSGVREAVRSLPFPARFRQSYCCGLNVPLTYPLPKRLDLELQQFTPMHRYDAIVLAGIDPVLLDADDLLNLLAYVQRGGGLMLIGGTLAFGNAQRGFGPLDAALPGRPALRPDTRGEAEVRLCGSAPITRGLSGGLGRVSVVQALDVKPTAQVVAEANGMPLVVYGTYGAGRVVMVATFANPDQKDNMFLAPAWGELARQALSWLMKRDGDLVIERAEMDRTPMQAGESRTFVLELSPDATKPIGARATARLADEGWLAAGREPIWGEAREIPVRLDGERVECELGGETKGLHLVRIEVSGPGWANVREAQVEVRTPAALKLRTRREFQVTAPGRQMIFDIASEAAPAPCTLRVLDFDGQEVFRAEAEAPGSVGFEVPQLETGPYEAVAERDGEQARVRFLVTAPLRELGLTVVSMVNFAHPEDRTEEFYEYHRDRGFNGFSTQLHLDDPDSAQAKACRYAPYLAQRDGHVVWGEYADVRLLSTHGHQYAEGTHPTRPCLNTPEHATALRELLERNHRAAYDIPRMASLEILDEPHIYRGDVCRCEVCLKLFEQKHGHPMPTWDEAVDYCDQRTRDFFDWVVGYATEAFRMGYEIWRTFPKGPMLHHVLSQMGSCRQNIRTAVANDLPWSPHADFLEFDCYNYQFGHWRCNDVLRFAEFHYHSGEFRALSLRNKQPLGFFIQLTDWDAPTAPLDPAKSSSELFYSAIGAGAKYFHMMASEVFAMNLNGREERFEALAEDIKKAQRAAPLLSRGQSPRRHVAMMIPYYDHMYRPADHYLPEGYVGLGFYGYDERPYDTTWPYHIPPFNVAELLFRSFGELDTLFDSALAEGALDDYEALLIPGTEYLPDEAVKPILKFVERGGALLCDRVPHHLTGGKETDALEALFTGQDQIFWGDMKVRYCTYGKGKTLLFSQELQEVYSSSIEQNQPTLRYLLKDTIKNFLFGCGIRPHARSSNYEIEADVLLTDETIVLVVVSHAEDKQRSRITLYRPPVPVRYAFDLVTMQEHEISHTEEGIEINVELGEREGLILGLYAQKPTTAALEADGSGEDRLAFSATLLDARGKPARGDHVVEVEVTDPAGERRINHSGLRCTTNGVLRVDEPFAINARRGTWTVSVFDRYTRIKNCVTIEH